VEEIEQRSAEVLAKVPDWMWDGRSLPVPVEDIADSVAGLLVCDKEPEEMAAAPGFPALDEDQTISGLLLPSLGEIWVNAEEARQWPGRRRFTIAHELGHHYLHQRGQGTLFCRHGSVEAGEAPADRPPLPEIESEANWFAASLLMPAEMVRRHYAKTGGDFDRLCAIFSSSRAAMGRRLHQTV
jgi:uncharacterized protein DUF955